MNATSVAELVSEMHADEVRGVADVMKRYRELVCQAASGKALTPAEATTAASCAYELGFAADRFDRDVATVKAERTLAAQVEQDDASKEVSRAKGVEYRERLKALEHEIRDVRVAMHRLAGSALERTNRRTMRAQMLAANPHLFKTTDTLTDAEWKAVRG